MYFIGIDPGADAGFAFITAKDRCIAYESPKYLEDIFEILKNLNPKEVLIGLEKVGAVFGARSKSTFTFGTNYGFWHGVLKTFRLPWVDVTPMKWQAKTMIKPKRERTSNYVLKRKYYNAYKDALKMESIRSAQKAFPATKIPNHNVADAINIARYLMYLQEE